MDRDSNLHSPRKDEELDRELRGMLQGNRPTRAEDWRDPELSADEDGELEPGNLEHARTEFEDERPEQQ
jgi:hypothetical protein